MSPDPRDPNYNATRKTCPICWEAFTATGRQAKTRLYCSPECKRTAAARREVERTSHPNRPFSPRPAVAIPAPPPAPLPQLAAQRDCPHCGAARSPSSPCSPHPKPLAHRCQPQHPTE